MGRVRLGFLGLGWIGAMRMEAVAASGVADVVALCEPDAERLGRAAAAHPEAERFTDFEAMLECAVVLGLDGLVIATPNALHAAQAIAALERGLAVFCQKPLALNAAEARAVVDAARSADRLLGIDYSYRYTDGAQALKRVVGAGELGHVFHIDAVFHNAYGPDKAWCRDPALSGGGALMDLGVHLVDLALWLLGGAAVAEVHGQAYRAGEPLSGPGIDDFAVARILLENGGTVNIGASWNAHAGRDCVIRASLFGTRGGAELRNVDGSFYDFETERFDGRSRAPLASESREWLGRGIVAWARRLADSRAYDAEADAAVTVAEVIDGVYGRVEATVQV